MALPTLLLQWATIVLQYGYIPYSNNDMPYIITTVGYCNFTVWSIPYCDNDMTYFITTVGY